MDVSLGVREKLVFVRMRINQSWNKDDYLYLLRFISVRCVLNNLWSNVWLEHRNPYFAWQWMCYAYDIIASLNSKIKCDGHSLCVAKLLLHCDRWYNVRITPSLKRQVPMRDEIDNQAVQPNTRMMIYRKQVSFCISMKSNSLCLYHTTTPFDLFMVNLHLWRNGKKVMQLICKQLHSNSQTCINITSVNTRINFSCHKSVQENSYNQIQITYVDSMKIIRSSYI